MKWILVLMAGLWVQKCNHQIASPTNTSMKQPSVDVQGHRGCRGLMPENSIPAFLKAVEIGVNTLEMDVAISADLKVIVSHEPYFSHEICRDPVGRDIGEADENSHNIFQMPLSDIQQYDCGSKPHPRFPGQLKIKTYKPTLEEVFTHVEAWTSGADVEKIKYNIEIKRDSQYDNHFHPPAEQFISLVMSVIEKAKLSDRVTLQSFDIESLELCHRLYPNISLAYLVEQGTYSDNMLLLSFRPDIYSPYFNLVNDTLIRDIRRDKLKIIPWTVNEPADIAKILSLGVDGIISDYPDRVFSILRQANKS
jgi:glycerophosphoryl diester phosphodiesterase